MLQQMALKMMPMPQRHLQQQRRHLMRWMIGIQNQETDLDLNYYMYNYLKH